MTAAAQCTGAVHKAPPSGGACPCGRVVRVLADAPSGARAKDLNHVERGSIVSGEPTPAQAADLVQHLMGAGVVARLDLVHGALVAAFRAGRAAERAEVQRLAEQHAAAFAAAVSQRADEQAAQASQPWNLQ